MAVTFLEEDAATEAPVKAVFLDDDSPAAPESPVRAVFLEEESVEPPPEESPSLGDYARLLPASIARSGSEALSGAARAAKMIPGAMPALSAPAELSAFFGGPDLRDTATQLGRDLADRALSDYGVKPEAQNTFAGGLVQGVGSVVPVLASGPLSVGTGAFMAAEGSRDEAERMGATEEQQAKAFVWNGVVGALTEKLLGVPALLKSAKKSAEPVLESLGKQIATQVAKGFGREGLQESLQQFAQDSIAKWVAAYDPERNIFDLKKLGQTFFTGGLVGGALGGTVQLAAAADARLRARQATLPVETVPTVAPVAEAAPEEVMARIEAEEPPAVSPIAPELAPPQAQVQQLAPPATPSPEVDPNLGVSPVETTPEAQVMEERIMAILQRHKISNDPQEKKQLWAEAMALEQQAVQSEQEQPEAPEPQPEQEMAAIAEEQPPQPAPLNPEPFEEPAIQEAEPVPSGEPIPQPAVQETGVDVAPSVKPEATIGIRNAITDKVAEAMQLPARQTPERIGAEQQLGEARAVIDQNPQVGRNLITRLKENPRAVNYLEDGILTYELASRVAQANQAIAKVNAATTSEEKAEAEAELRVAREAVQEAIEVDRTVGTETARGLEARKRIINQQYELPIMQAELQAAKGEELSTTESEKVSALHDDIQKSQQEVERLENAVSDAEAKTVFDNLLVEEGKTAQQQAKAGKSLLDSLKQGHDEALKNIRKRLGQTNAGVDPTVLYDVARIGAYHIANGAKKIADFTKKVVAEVGEWIRPNIEQVFAQSQAIHDANQQAFQTAKKAKPVDLNALAEKDAEAGTLSHKLAYETVRQKIQQGVEGFDAVMQAATDELSQRIPGVDRRQVGQAFSEYGKTQFPSKEDLNVKLSEYRRLEQLAQAIRDVQEGKPPKKSGMQRNKPTQDVRAMTAQLRAEMDKAGIETQSPEDQLASRNQARATALRNQIADLEKRIQTGQKPVKGATQPDSAEVTQLKKQRDAMRAEADRLYPADDEARRIQTALKAINRSTKEVQRRIKEGDFKPKPKRDPAESQELEAARFRNAKAKQEYHRLLFEEQLRQQSLPRKALRTGAEVANTARAVMTSADFSAMLRQGGFISLGHPVRAAKAVPAMLRAFSSEKGAFAVDDEISRRPNAKLYQQAKLYLAEQNNHLPSKMEEAYMSRWAQKIPGVAGSARAYSTFLNKLRADSFDAMAATLSATGKPTLEESKAIANFINVATGRAPLGRLEPAGQALATVFFSPRYVASRFQLLGGQPFYGGNARTRKLVAQEYGRFLIGVSVVYGLLAAAQDDKDPLVEMDSRSSDFGKVRFGNTRVDPLSGLAQVSTFLAREITGETKTLGGDIRRLREGMRPLNLLRDKDPTKKDPFGSDGADVAGRFLRTKLAPVPGAIVNAIAGRNVIGEETSLVQEGINMTIPLSFRDIAETMKEQGIPRGTILTMLSLLGAGVQTYAEKEKK